MKKLLIMVVSMAAALSANAQFEPGTFSLQPKMGATGSLLTNMPSVTVPNMGNTSGISIDKAPTAGFIIGAEAEYQLTNTFSLAAGVNYAQQGSGWKDTDFNISGTKVKMRDAKIELGYVNVPILLNAYLFKGFALKAGVQLGFMTNASEKVTVEGSAGNVTEKYELDQDVMDNMEKFDVSIPVGISYQFKVPIVIDARYNIGLTNAIKDNGDESYKNMSFQLTVGYKFAL